MSAAKQHPCPQCGIQFDSSNFLKSHMDRGCQQDDESGDEDNSAWAEMVNEAYEEHTKLYEEKAAQLQSQGMSEKDIENEVT